MTAPKTSDDLAMEAMELIRRKNLKFHVKTAGKSWACTFTPREEYEKSRAAAKAAEALTTPATVSSAASTSTSATSSSGSSSKASSIRQQGL